MTLLGFLEGGDGVVELVLAGALLRIGLMFEQGIAQELDHGPETNFELVAGLGPAEFLGHVVEAGGRLWDVVEGSLGDGL